MDVILSGRLQSVIAECIPEALRNTLNDERERLCEIEHDCSISNSEWHCYEMALDRTKSRQANWLRFVCTDGPVELEGYPIALKEHGAFLEQLKDGLEIRGSSLTIYRMPIPQA